MFPDKWQAVLLLLFALMKSFVMALVDRGDEKT